MDDSNDSQYGCLITFYKPKDLFYKAAISLSKRDSAGFKYAVVIL